MTITQIELAILTVVLVGVAVAIVLTYRGIVRLVGDREKAMDVHAKAVSRQALTVTNDARGALDECQRVREDSRLMLERVERHMSDPRVKRILEG